MARIVGSVTRQGTSTRRQQFAAYLSGQRVGTFRSLSAARLAVQRSFGGRPLRWVRDDLRGVVQESWRAEDTDFLPDQIDGLLLWSETTVVTTISPSDARADLWGDQSLNKSNNLQTVQGNMPFSVDGVSTPNGFRALSFATDGGGEKFMINRDVVVDLTRVTIIVAAAPIAAGANQRQAVVVGTDGSNTDVGLNNAGQWEASNAGDRLVGPAAPAGTPAVVTYRQDANGGRLQVNDIVFDANPTVPGDNFTNVTISALTAGLDLPWGGLLWAVLIYGRPLTDGEITLNGNYLSRYVP